MELSTPLLLFALRSFRFLENATMKKPLQSDIVNCNPSQWRERNIIERNFKDVTDDESTLLKWSWIVAHTPVSVLCFGKPYNASGVWGRVPVSTSWTNGSQWTKCFYAKMHRKASESHAEIQFVTRVHAWRVGLSGILLLLTRLYSIRCGRLHYHTDFFGKWCLSNPHYNYHIYLGQA